VFIGHFGGFDERDKKRAASEVVEVLFVFGIGSQERKAGAVVLEDQHIPFGGHKPFGVDLH
jgi:hypothetical protein